MNDNMMKDEVKYLREHLRDIYQYKSSMADLTYDMPLQLLSRCCIAFDYLQQELQRKDNIINVIKEELSKDFYTYVCVNKSYGKTFKAGVEVYKQHLLYKIKELENSGSDE